MKKRSEHNEELAQIRVALEVSERLRFKTELSDKEQREYEKASIALRRRERVLIETIGNEIASHIKTTSADLEQLVKRIRERNTTLSKTATWILTLSRLLGV
jgi:hypothetical protein